MIGTVYLTLPSINTFKLLLDKILDLFLYNVNALIGYTGFSFTRGWAKPGQEWGPRGVKPGQGQKQ